MGTTFLTIYNEYIVNVLDIAIMAIVFYRIILVIRGTRAMQIVAGILILLICTIISKNVLHLRAVSWILSNFWTMGVLILSIAFQSEIRSFLAQIGSNFKPFAPPQIKHKNIEAIVEAAESLSEAKYGGLIAVENEIGLRSYADTGIPINAVITKELLLSIFKNKNSPLHDGAVIIYDEKIMAASCILPLSIHNANLSMHGTRHRAALGLSEATDAIVVVISEETGQISIAFRGTLYSNLTGIEIKEILITKGRVLIKNEKVS